MGSTETCRHTLGGTTGYGAGTPALEFLLPSDGEGIATCVGALSLVWSLSAQAFSSGFYSSLSSGSLCSVCGCPGSSRSLVSLQLEQVSPNPLTFPSLSSPSIVCFYLEGQEFLVLFCECMCMEVRGHLGHHSQGASTLFF